MSEQKHTPEPWSIDDGDSELVGLFADDLDAIAYACDPLFPNQGKPLRGYDVDRANLQRAAACVNALAGIDDPAALLRDVRAVLVRNWRDLIRRCDSCPRCSGSGKAIVERDPGRACLKTDCSECAELREMRREAAGVLSRIPPVATGGTVTA